MADDVKANGDHTVPRHQEPIYKRVGTVTYGWPSIRSNKVQQSIKRDKVLARDDARAYARDNDRACLRGNKSAHARNNVHDDARDDTCDPNGWDPGGEPVKPCDLGLIAWGR